MIRRTQRRRAAVRAAAVLGAAGLTAAAPAAAHAAGGVTVNYNGCVSSNTSLSAAPPPYSTTVTLTASSSSGTTGKAITVTWHQALSTAPGPIGIPVANAATAKAKILVGGAASSTITAGPSKSFPDKAVGAGGTFQIPGFSATFTPKLPGTYTFTPGDNEEDALGGLVITCKANGASSALSITVTGDPVSGGGPDISTLPHTGFDGRRLVAGAAGAAVLGAGALVLTRRRAGAS